MQPLRGEKPDTFVRDAVSPGAAGATPYDVLEVAQSRLADTPFPVLREVACQFDRGVLILRGHLPSFYLKSVAQEAVRNLDGVRQVVNEIEVGG